MHPLLKYF